MNPPAMTRNNGRKSLTVKASGGDSTKEVTHSP